MMGEKETSTTSIPTAEAKAEAGAPDRLEVALRLIREDDERPAGIHYIPPPPGMDADTYALAFAVLGEWEVTTHSSLVGLIDAMWYLFQGTHRKSSSERDESR